MRRTIGFSSVLALRLAGLAALLCWATGCLETPGLSSSSSSSTTRRRSELPNLIVSGPASGSAGLTPPGGANYQADGGTVFVSLLPGSVPEGLQATIRNETTGLFTTVAVVGGGFDPVAVAGNAGDTLAVEVVRSGGLGPVHGWEMVVRRPPIVVRTDPPPRKRDVPLNSVMIIVFSEPIEPATLNPGSVQLWLGTTPVAGTVRLNDAGGLRAELDPDAPLSAETEYRLVITPDVHDKDGEPLAGPVAVTFTTAAAEPQPLASIRVTPDLVELRGNSTQQFTAIGIDAAGNSVAISPVWSVIGGGGSITSGGLFTAGTQAGDFAVQAASGGVSGRATVTVTAQGLARIVILPQLATVASNATRQFTALGIDASGETVAITPAWSVVNGGTISSSGLFTAGPVPGLFPWTVQATAAGVSAEATVSVTPAAGMVFAAVTAGGQHSCGMTQGGAAYCWGDNTHGALGDGTTASRSTPVAVAGGRPFYLLSAGGSHTCATSPSPWMDNFVTYCWGGNTSGQLGDGTTLDRSVPHIFDSTFVAGAIISVGRSHTCLLDLWAWVGGHCWGANGSGQLGNATTIDRTTPSVLRSPGSSHFERVSAGGSHTCAEAGGYEFLTYSWYCWGANANGQLGDGTTTDRTSWVSVGGGMAFDYAGVSAGGQHTCGVTLGAVYCWGLNSSGQLGDGTTTQRVNPTRIATTLRFVVVSAGDRHTCGITDTGAAYCWGANERGQLGDGTTTGSSSPVPVAGGFRFAGLGAFPLVPKLSAGGSHTCGVTDSGALYCWGANEHGQLGNGALLDSAVPVPVGSAVLLRR